MINILPNILYCLLSAYTWRMASLGLLVSSEAYCLRCMIKLLRFKVKLVLFSRRDRLLRWLVGRAMPRSFRLWHTREYDVSCSINVTLELFHYLKCWVVRCLLPPSLEIVSDKILRLDDAVTNWRRALN